FVPALLLELAIRLPFFQSSLIRYATAAPSRGESVKETQKTVSFGRQLWTSCTILLGPTAILNAALGPLLAEFLFPEISGDFPTLSSFLIGFAVMQLAGDFFLYWGHRIQHTNSYLWEHYHSLHHKIATPSPVSAIYIDSVDATLQAALPMTLAAVIARPHPLTFYVYILARIGENVFNHSGLNSLLLDVLFLKVLPGRASVAHHDSHHRFSKGGPSAKNYAENFWIWDWMFGTFRKPGNV
ncbi:MAG: sterol desaturase family protein, partial [archaeon]|nr:sterol desaturase family protein [archaeon]